MLLLVQETSKPETEAIASNEKFIATSHQVT